MSNKPVKTVQATCACGAVFTREVKRGRPQVWCPACAVVPFYERVNERAIAETAANLGEMLEGLKPERIVNENDPLDHVRVEIEAAVAAIYEASLPVYHARVAEGMEPWDAGSLRGQEDLAALKELYEGYRK